MLLRQLGFQEVGTAAHCYDATSRMQRRLGCSLLWSVAFVFSSRERDWPMTKRLAHHLQSRAGNRPATTTVVAAFLGACACYAASCYSTSLNLVTLQLPP